jgi:hypothetical protein
MVLFHSFPDHGQICPTNINAMKKRCFLLLFALFPLFIVAQNDRAMMDKLLTEDASELEAIALYPENIRISILEASIHPEVLVRMQSMQSQTSDRFKMIIGQLNREDQERVWEITRYPGLLKKIVTGGKKSADDLKLIASGFPEGIRESAVEYGRKEYNLLNEIFQLNRLTESTFDEILAPYPSATRTAYLDLLDHPEILSILSDNMNMTVVLGDLYKRNPAYVMQKTDSISLVLAETNAKELEDWKKSLEDNPEALKDLESAAGEYAREQGYTEDVYQQPVTEAIEVQYVYQPYPYWYGYPWWYSYDDYYLNYSYNAPVVYVLSPRHRTSWWYAYPRWYPRPWWYDWGFYYGPSNQIIIWSLPSYNFCYWHFSADYHHYYYPHLSDHYVTWNQHHRNSTSSLGRSVRNWENENKGRLPGNLLNNDPGRVERFREYGHLETSLSQYNQQHPGKQIDRSTYLDKNPKSYPNLTRPTGTLEARPAPASNVTPRNVTSTPIRKPKLKDPIWDTRPRTEPTRTPVRVNPPRIQTETPRSTQQINRAKDYHQGTWQQANPQTRPQRVPVRITPPSRTPVKAPAGNTSRPTGGKSRR